MGSHRVAFESSFLANKRHYLVEPTTEVGSMAISRYAVMVDTLITTVAACANIAENCACIDYAKSSESVLSLALAIDYCVSS